MTHNDPVEAPGSHSPGPAASETPQGAICGQPMPWRPEIGCALFREHTAPHRTENGFVEWTDESAAELQVETPQDARGVERRERWGRAIAGLLRLDARPLLIDRAIAEADREHADLVKRAEDAEARLAQAVSEREEWFMRASEARALALRMQRAGLGSDSTPLEPPFVWAEAVRRAEDAEAREARLRAGIEALLGDEQAKDEMRRQQRKLRIDTSPITDRLRALLATPDADAQYEPRPDHTPYEIQCVAETLPKDSLLRRDLLSYADRKARQHLLDAVMGAIPDADAQDEAPHA